MTGARLQVSDKVALHPWHLSPAAAKPRLRHGRLYCVNQVAEHDGQQFVALVGVEFRTLRPDRRARDPQGKVVLYTADTFTLVAPARSQAEP